MKRFVASAAIVLAALSGAGTQETCHPKGKPDLAGVVGSTIVALAGSTLGDERGQSVATGVGALLGTVIGQCVVA